MSYNLLLCASVILIILGPKCLNASVISSVYSDGFDVLHLDYPSFITDFHFNWGAQKFYVYGNSYFRPIEHDHIFAALDDATLRGYDQSFIDVHTFTPFQTTEVWAIGPVNNIADRSAIGYFTPVGVIGPNVNEPYQGDHRGFLFSATHIDDRNLSNIIAYFVGYGPSDINLNMNAVDFMVVRSYLSIRPFAGISWNNDTDTCFLHQNDFVPFHSSYKPEIIRDWVNNKLYIISPHQQKIWRVKVPEDGEESERLLLEDSVSISIGLNDKISGTNFHSYNDKLYIGYSSVGTSEGTLIEFDLARFAITSKLTFAANFSNPRAITGKNSSIYVGFEGGPAIVAVDRNTFKISGYASLPGYLSSVYSAWDEGTNHVYFATHEQKSKVFRVDKSNFCSKLCINRAYCLDGNCICDLPYTINSDATGCTLVPVEKDIVKVEKGAAIALGVLFAIMVVFAGAGWFLVWRSKQQGYQRVM